MLSEEVGKLVQNVGRAVEFVPKVRDPAIYKLLESLQGALRDSDKDALRRAAERLVDHSTYRYAAVVEQADRLVRYLDDSP